MRKGFTSAEALLVCAVVAVLFALLSALMDHLARTGGGVHKPVCKGNIHALGMALTLYGNDYDQHWPTCAAADPNPFDKVHGDESGNAAWFFKSRNSLARLYPDYADSIEIFDCPQARPARATCNDNGTPKDRSDDYIDNLGYVIDDDFQGGQMRAIAGDLNNDDHDGPAGTKPTGLNGQEAMNHPGGSNVLFLDTSLSWLDRRADGTHPNKYNEKADPDVYRDNGGASDSDDASLEENN
jgi:prepilin-type processing-associated H-X9-DG protein